MVMISSSQLHHVIVTYLILVVLDTFAEVTDKGCPKSREIIKKLIVSSRCRQAAF